MTRVALLGLFILAALLALLAGVFLIGERQFLFRSTYHVRSEFETVAGLSSGAEVRIGGIRKGTVSDIRLPDRPGGKVLVTMDVDSSTRHLVKKDSQAAIETEGLLGNKFVAVSIGTEGAEPVRDWEVIAGARSVDYNDLIKKTNAIMDTTYEALKNVDVATAHVATITTKIDSGQGTIGALVNDRKLYERLDATMSDTRETVEQAKVGVTAFQENMQALKKNFFFRGFFKNRGYMDSADLTKHEIAKLPPGTPMRKFIFHSRDLFDKPETAKLKNRKLLQEAGHFLEQNRWGAVVVTAHAPRAGDRDENLVRTQAQAMVVRDYLVDHFEVDDARIKTKGMGEAAAEEARDAWVEVLVFTESQRPVLTQK